jgi:hypothetical protein
MTNHSLEHVLGAVLAYRDQLLNKHLQLGEVLEGYLCRPPDGESQCIHALFELDKAYTQYIREIFMSLCYSSRPRDN